LYQELVVEVVVVVSGTVVVVVVVVSGTVVVVVVVVSGTVVVVVEVVVVSARVVVPNDSLDSFSPPQALKMIINNTVITKSLKLPFSLLFMKSF
jgi:hypothetical protein